MTVGLSASNGACCSSCWLPGRWQRCRSKLPAGGVRSPLCPQGALRGGAVPVSLRCPHRAPQEARGRPAKPAAVDEAQARLHLERGEELLQRGEWKAAEQALREAVALHPASALAWSKLGVALARQGRYAEAEEVLLRAVQLDPRCAPAHNNLGNVYREQGRREDALRAYRQAIAADPDYWVAHQNLGALYKEMGRLGEAVAEFRTATRLSVRGPRGQRRGCLGPFILGVGGVLVVALLGASWLARHMP